METKEYRTYTKPAELHKAINTLRGILAGITADGIVSDDEINELVNWISVHGHLEDRHPFNELVPMIKAFCEKGNLDKEDVADIVWLCTNFVSDSNYYDLITSNLQFLSGMLHGILADDFVSDEEIHSLKKWLVANEYLAGNYPFDEINSLLSAVLLDDIVTDDERNMLKAYFSEFVDLSTSYNLNENEINKLRQEYKIDGVCSICQEIDFQGKVFCFTGASQRATRNEIAQIIADKGGTLRNAVSNSTDYVIVGNSGNPCWAYSCYGRKIEEAINLRKKGKNIIIVNEVDFWDILEDHA